MGNLAELNVGELINKARVVIFPEKRIYINIIIYGLFVSILGLTIPLSVQALVNTVAIGVLYQPLIILSFVLFLLLVLSATLKALQLHTVEIYQRKVYARLGSQISIELAKSSKQCLKDYGARQITNKYFDIMTIQKNISTFTMNTIAILIQTLIGLFLLAFYHPYFVIFDVILMISLWFVWKFFAKNAIRTSIAESYEKYNVCDHLENYVDVKMEGQCTDDHTNMFLDQADQKITTYLNARKSHFKYFFTQQIALLVVYAFFSAIILGLGGFLVIEGELSLGQLVASELVVTAILGSLAKLGKDLESFYDLVAGMDKVYHFFELNKTGVK